MTEKNESLASVATEARPEQARSESRVHNYQNGKAGSTGTDADKLEAVPFSEDALAAKYGDKYYCELRYVPQWHKWMLFHGNVWREDYELEAFSHARGICRSTAQEANEPSERKVLSSSKTVAAVERMARSDARMVALPGQWDADPWLLNTYKGVIDLKTGTMRNHDDFGRDYLTKMTAVTPDETCSIKTWMGFLDRVTASDPALQNYLQRVCGYSLTGDTREHALFFLYGTGGNGKSKFLEAIIGCVGDYHRTAPIETFTASNSDRHPTELAGLRGARMVTATETEKGRRWAEAKVKMLTGGDAVSARFMRGDFFDFVPQFKLMVSGNHKPGLRSVDEAIRRRFHLIPFTVTIPPQERDPDLGNKLRKEWPGILAWAIHGCVEWQRLGLAPPPMVTEATSAYFASQDAIGTWMEECTDGTTTAWTARTELFTSWQAWASKAGAHAGTRSEFLDALEGRGLEPRKRDGERGFVGIALKPKRG